MESQHLLLQVCQKTGTDEERSCIFPERSRRHRLSCVRTGWEILQISLLLLCETNLGIIRSVIEKERPELVIIDSIQTMYSEEVTSAPGSVSQVRESTNVFMQLGERTVHSNFYCRTCNKRRNGSRSASAGAYGRYSTLF